MTSRLMKSFTVAVFSLFSLFISLPSFAKEGGDEPTGEKKKTFNAQEVIFGHILDAHEFHFFSYKGSDGEEHEASIPLPVILYSPQRGMSVFNFSKFHHGEEAYKGYKVLSTDKIKELNLDEKAYHDGQIVAVNESGQIDNNVKVYDFSLTRNVVQMLLAIFLLAFLMIKVANKYKTGVGTTKAPTGFQNAIELATFVHFLYSI